MGNLTLYASTSCMMMHRWRGVTRDCDNKAHYIWALFLIHSVNLTFTGSQKSNDVEIVRAEI